MPLGPTTKRLKEAYSHVHNNRMFTQGCQSLFCLRKMLSGKEFQSRFADDSPQWRWALVTLKERRTRPKPRDLQDSLQPGAEDKDCLSRTSLPVSVEKTKPRTLLLFAENRQGTILTGMSDTSPEQLRRQLQSRGWSCTETRQGEWWTVNLESGEASVVQIGRNRLRVWERANQDARQFAAEHPVA